MRKSSLHFNQQSAGCFYTYDVPSNKINVLNQFNPKTHPLPHRLPKTAILD